MTHLKRCSVKYDKDHVEPNVQQILQKVTIRKTKLCLDLGVNIDEMEGACGHSCEKCGCLINGDKTFFFSQSFQP